MPHATGTLVANAVTSGYVMRDVTAAENGDACRVPSKKDALCIQAVCSTTYPNNILIEGDTVFMFQPIHRLPRGFETRRPWPVKSVKSPELSHKSKPKPLPKKEAQSSQFKEYLPIPSSHLVASAPKRLTQSSIMRKLPLLLDIF